MDNLDLTIDSLDVHNTHSGKTFGVHLKNMFILALQIP